MIKNPDVYEKWKWNQMKLEPVDVKKNFAIVEMLYAEAKALGIFPLKDPLEGLVDKIRFLKELRGSKHS